MAFLYNADGLRIRKESTTRGVTEYTLSGKRLKHLKRGQIEMHFWYAMQERPTMLTYNNQEYLYVYNGQGDVVALVDPITHEAVVRYGYDAWGKQIICSGTMASTLGRENPLRYRGYLYDEETELYYLRSRYYNPEMGRFINADTNLGLIGKELAHNCFSYCMNNAVCFCDPDGRAQCLSMDGGGGSPKALPSTTPVSSTVVLPPPPPPPNPVVSTYLPPIPQVAPLNVTLNGEHPIGINDVEVVNKVNIQGSTQKAIYELVQNIDEAAQDALAQAIDYAIVGLLMIPDPEVGQIATNAIMAVLDLVVSDTITHSYTVSNTTYQVQYPSFVSTQTHTYTFCNEKGCEHNSGKVNANASYPQRFIDGSTQTYWKFFEY